MNKIYWGAYNNETGSLLTTPNGTPALVPSRTLARTLVSSQNKSAGHKFKVVRVGFSIEHRLHDGKWTLIS